LGKLEGMAKPPETVDKALRMAQQSDSELRKRINKLAENGGSKSKANELRKKEQDLRKRMEELKQQYDLTKKSFLESRSLLKNKKLEKESLTKQLAKIDNIQNLREEQQQIIQKLLEIESKLSGIELPNLEEIEEEIEKIRKAIEFQKLKKELDEVANKYQEVNSQIKLVDFDSERYSSLQKEKEGLIQRISSLKAKIEGHDQLISEKNKSKKNLENEIKSIDESSLKLKKEKKIIERAQILQNALKDAQQILRKEFVNTVNLAMSSVWETLYPYQDYPGVRMDIISEGMKRGDYNLQLEERTGNWIPVDLASGGERSMACLALRIAFVKVLVPNFKLLILDEPTHNLDSRGVDELSNALRERVSSLLEQVLVITHDEKLEKAVTGSCFKLDRDKGRDQPSKVLEV
jgi:DNA sulfur modification protein DndD